jgi:hypothetical protein
MAARVVGCALIEHADDDGVAWPSVVRLREFMGAGSDHTVLNGLRELERHGLLLIERSLGSSNRYRLVLPETSTADSAVPPLHQPLHLALQKVQPNHRTKEPKNRGRANARRTLAVDTEWVIARAAELDAAEGDER